MIGPGLFGSYEREPEAPSPAPVGWRQRRQSATSACEGAHHPPASTRLHPPAYNIGRGRRVYMKVLPFTSSLVP